MKVDLSDLNPPQREAVLHENGPLLVLAGAGSGKTRVITYRMARLLKDGVPPHAILGVTFTNKAARQMRDRLRTLIGDAARDVWLGTFHALGLTLLKQEGQCVGLKAGFCIYDTGDQLGLIRELLRQTKVADRRLDVYRILELILKAKRQRMTEVPIVGGDDYELAAYDLYPRYVQQMHAFNSVDFDDLLLLAQNALGHADVRQRWQTKYSEVLVDEFQDTSPDQVNFIRTLSEKARCICAVGDDDQSIYAWRGAAADNILSFSRQFPGTREIVLDQNYRSTHHILMAANTVIKHNAKRKEKSLWSDLGHGDLVERVPCRDGEDEAAFVCEEIHKLSGQGVRYSDIAVLYRSNVQSRVFEEQCALERIPFSVVGGQSFFDRKEVRDALAYLSIVCNPRDEISLRRIVNVPPRGIGAASLLRLVQHAEDKNRSLWEGLRHSDEISDLPAAAKHGVASLLAVVTNHATLLREANAATLVERVQAFFDALRLRESIVEADDAAGVAARRLENLREVLTTLERFCRDYRGNEPLKDFVWSTTLLRGPEEDDETNNSVTLMTLHSAKGLEFPYVFLVGLEEDLLPHRRTFEMDGDLGEERRLFYVGITRARQHLWLTWARQRALRGRMQARTPSRFMQDLNGCAAVAETNREATSNEKSEQLANDFFAKMRAQLGIDA